MGERDTLTELEVKLEQIEKTLNEIKTELRKTNDLNKEVTLLKFRVEQLEKSRSRMIGFVSGIVGGSITGLVAALVKWLMAK